MPNTNSNITFNVVDSNGQVIRQRSFTVTKNIKENNFINSVIKVADNNSITEADEKKLEGIAKRFNVWYDNAIEDADMTPDEKLALAKQNPNYSKHYNLSLSEDKKFLVVEVKKTNFLYPDPQMQTIKADFGVRNNVLVEKNYIPHGNAETINKHINVWTYDDRNINYDKIEFEAGDKINIPIEEVYIQPKSAGFWSFDRPWF